MAPQTSSGLNTYQLAGLIGTATSQVMSATSSYSQASSNAAGLSLQAGMDVAGATMSTTQMGIDAALQKIMREQEQADLTYQSQRQEISAELVEAQKSMVQAEAEAQQTELLRTLNKSDTNIVMSAVAQNRTGATVENLRAQQRYRADQEIGLINSVLTGKEAELNASQADLIAQSKISSLTAQSSKAVSAYEQESAKIGAEYTTKSAASMAAYKRSAASAQMKSANTQLVGSLLSSAASSYASYGSIK